MPGPSTSEDGSQANARREGGGEFEKKSKTAAKSAAKSKAAKTAAANTAAKGLEVPPAKLQRRLEESESDESQTLQPDPSQPSEPKASRPAPTGSEQPHKKNKVEHDEIFLAPAVFTLTPRQVQNLSLAGALFLCYGSGALRVGAGLYQRPEASGHEDSRI